MKKKVIFFYKNLITYGGAEKLLIKEMNLMAEKNNIEVSFYSFGICEDLKKKISSKIIILEDHKRNKFMDYFIYPIKLIQFYRILSRGGYDLLISASGILEAGLLCKLTNTNYSFELHHPVVMLPLDSYRSSRLLRKKINKSYPESWLYNTHTRRPLIRIRSDIEYLAYYFFFKGANNLYVLSDFARIEKLKLLNIKSVVLQGASDFEEHPNIHLRADNNSQRKQKLFKFCSIGRIAPEKNLELMIESFALVNKHVTNIRLDLYGDGNPEYVNFLKMLCSKLDIHDKVKFYGYIEDPYIFNTLSKSDAFLYTQYADYSIAVFEALISSCPVVLWENCWLPKDLLNDNSAYFSKLNCEDYAVAMLKAYNNKSEVKDSLINKNFFDHMSYKKRVKELLHHEDLI